MQDLLHTHVPHFCFINKYHANNENNVWIPSGEYPDGEYKNQIRKEAEKKFRFH